MRVVSGWMISGLLTLGALALLVQGCRGPETPPPTQTAASATPTASQPARIQGEVRLQGQQDASGIQVYIPGTSAVSITGPDGRYTISGVEPGEYEVRARAEGYRDADLGKVSVVPSNKSEVYTLDPLTLAPRMRAAAQGIDGRSLGAIRGQMDSPDGAINDWTGCLIDLEKTDFRTITAPSGDFLLWNLPPDQYQLTARMPGFAPVSVPVRVLPGPDPTTVTVSMRAQPDLTTGTLITRNFAPSVPRLAAAAALPTSSTARIHGVALKDQENLQDMSGITIALAGTSLIVTTAADGKFHIDNIKPGSYQLLAQAEGFEPAQVQLTLQPGEDQEVAGLLLEPKRNYPEVLETNPVDGARGVAIIPEIPLLVRFSKKMKPDSLRQAVRFDPPVAFRIEAGKDSPDTDFDLMKVLLSGVRNTPIARFRTRYTMTITQDATDVEGLTLQEPYRMSFTTGDPEVIRTSPANGATAAPLSPMVPVLIFFNAPMSYSSLSPEAIRIQPSLGTAPNLGLREDPATGWSQLIINASWKPDTAYTITVMRRARTLSNNPLSNTPYSFRFRTAKLERFHFPTVPQMAH